MSIIGNPILLSGGGSSKLNLFVNPSTPKTNEGIWLQTSENQNINAVVVDNRFYDTGTYSSSGVSVECDMYFAGENCRSIAIGNYVYTFGKRGTDPNDSSYSTGSVLIYDVVNGTTTTVHLSSYPIFKCLGLDYDGDDTIYVYYMYSMSSASNGERYFYVYKYSISESSHTFLHSIKLDKYTYLTSAVKIGDIVYAYGYNSDSNHKSEVTYNIVTNTGTAKTNGGTYYSDPARSHKRHFMISGVEYAYDSDYYEDSYILYRIYKVIRDGNNVSYSTAIGSFDQETLFGYSDYKSFIDLSTMAGYGDYLYFTSYVSSDGGLYRMDLTNGAVTKVATINENVAKGTVQLVYSASLNRLISYRIQDYGSYFYYLTPKQYPIDGTFIILKSNNQNGAYYTELAPYKETVTGDYIRFCTGFNDAYFYKDNVIMPASLYYGNGSSWVKIR